MVEIRALRDEDRAAVAALDTRYETRSIFELALCPRSITLVERTLPQPRVHAYPMGDVFAHWARWDTAFVADDGGIVGFAACELEPWHARMVLWHLYVAPSHRRAGIGRALLSRVEDEGRRHGAARVWLETTNVNVPGVAAYERMGYALVGADVTLYERTYAAGEQAIYLAKAL
ncbi:MAG: GNAT family N-acetyltransferase [Nannocystaceae bacterium]|nr:GNAT family N-acetyltransferase [Nannocystaceae bacterium]